MSKGINLVDKIYLNKIINDNYAKFNDSFKDYDFKSFTKNISLQEYQKEALKHAFLALKLWQQDLSDSLWYKYNDLDKKFKRENTNRASFWMATGSGKTLVMIKLISLLNEWILKGEIPKKPIMLLAPNEKILSQFSKSFNEFNNFQSKGIEVRELRTYENSSLNLYENLVYISRSDLLESEENVGKDSKAKRLNYKNFHSGKGWYILLDEAHKGDSKDSVRKKYINELARGLENLNDINNGYKRGGFIFNFSATFDDELDLQTCAFNYNLEKFNKQGYGKNIAVVDTLKAFKEKENDKEKLERIVESFILFWAIKKGKENLFEELENYGTKKPLYHNPLIIAVSDKVNTQDAGIKIYFEAIVKILQNEVENFENIVLNLYEKLKSVKVYYSNSNFSKEFLELIKQVNLDKLRESVFYAKELSSCEACRIKGNDKELVFKAKNSNKPFLLLNVGEKKKWENEFIQELGIEVGEDLMRGYFDNINELDSSINIMLGSKIFNEGWDSNRVNIINFINIGSAIAKKYVLQTIGRGVRIEPFEHQRKRLEYCGIDYDIKEKLKFANEGLESLFIMASDEKAVAGILEHIESFSAKNALRGFKLSKHFKPLLVPKYKNAKPLDEDYKISNADYENLLEYLNSYDEDVLLLSENLQSEDFGLSTLNKIRKKQGLKISGANERLEVKEAFRILDEFFSTSHKKLKDFKELSDELCHYKEFAGTLNLEIIDNINQKIKELVENSKNKSVKSKEELKAEGVPEQYIETILKSQTTEQKCEIYGYTLDATLKEHYYIPLIYKENDSDINYVISVRSEVNFLNDLAKYLKNSNNALKNYEWCFSKLVENKDNIYVPYFDNETQKLRKFYPDFIFWLRHKENKKYKILFIDPKGLTHEGNARDKARGFEKIFKQDEILFGEYELEVDLFYYSDNPVSDELKPYVKSQVEKIFSCL